MFNDRSPPVATARRRRSLAAYALIPSIAGGCASAWALEESSTPAPVLPEVSVIGATPLPGTRIDADKIPGHVQSMFSADLAQDGTASLIRTLGTRLSSVNIDDALADPFQPDILYRGFEASPVLGTPQGLAVYQNGVRINEAFGDTVNWDLIPDIAIDRVDIVSSSPLYGLNALGGAMTVSMKNGFTFEGARRRVVGRILQSTHRVGASRDQSGRLRAVCRRASARSRRMAVLLTRFAASVLSGYQPARRRARRSI